MIRQTGMVRSVNDTPALSMVKYTNGSTVWADVSWNKYDHLTISLNHFTELETEPIGNLGLNMCVARYYHIITNYDMED